MSPSSLAKRRFAYYAISVLIFTMIVIMWGAYVRATGSGAGCGEHWPLCNGEVIPRNPQIDRMIEFSHRLTSGLALLISVVLVFWARRLFPAQHAVRRAAYWALGFILGEAAVGAALVVLQLVAGNDSVLRAVVIAFHLINTFLLLYWQTRVAYLAWGPDIETTFSKQASRARWNIRLCMGALILTGAAGAVVALGDTLFPAKSLLQGMSEDFSATAHFLIKLRIWHPVIAVFATLFILLQSIALPRIFRNIVDSRVGAALGGLIVIQLLGGFLNWILLAPIWMQLVHLVLADLTWICLCVWYLKIGHQAGNPQKEV